jgi:hypothetical protein
MLFSVAKLIISEFIFKKVYIYSTKSIKVYVTQFLRIRQGLYATKFNVTKFVCNIFIQNNVYT